MTTEMFNSIMSSSFFSFHFFVLTMFNYHSQSISSASLVGSVLLTQCKQNSEEKGKNKVFFLLGRNQIFFFQLVEPLTAFSTSNTEIMFFYKPIGMIIIKLTKVKPYAKTLENAEGKKTIFVYGSSNEREMMMMMNFLMSI